MVPTHAKNLGSLGDPSLAAPAHNCQAGALRALPEPGWTALANLSLLDGFFSLLTIDWCRNDQVPGLRKICGVHFSNGAIEVHTSSIGGACEPFGFRVSLGTVAVHLVPLA